MKSKFKQLICMAMTLVMVVSLFAGCGETEMSSGEKKSNTGTSKTETSLSWDEVKKLIPENAKGRTIEVCSWNALDMAKQAPQVVKRFEEETGIKVKWTVTSDFRNIEVAARVAAGDSPDITRVRSASPADLKVLQPITESGYNFNDTAWDKAIMKYYSVSGMPLATAMKDSPFRQHTIVSYNKNLIDNYGLEDPYVLWKKGKWTWNKMHEIAEQFLAMAGEGYKGISQANVEYTAASGYPSIYLENGQYKHNLSTNEYVEACKYMSKYNTLGLYSNQALDVDGFNSGKLLFLFNSSISIRQGHMYYRELKEKGHVGVVPYPQIDGKDEFIQVPSEIEAYGFCKGAKNIDIAPFFLRYYLDAKNYDMKSFYCDEKFLSIIEWMDQQKQGTGNLAAALMQVDTTGMIHGAYGMDIIRTTPSQMKSKLDSLVPAFDAAMVEYTKQYKQIAADLEKEYGNK